jgi:hypothetical protein
MNCPENNAAEDCRVKRYLTKVISGGQTGVDRAGLDAAIGTGIPIGGYCPAGRRADDGTIPSKYPLVETASREYPVRTRINVEEADGTLIIISGSSDRGTQLTASISKQKRKPLLIIDLENVPEESTAINWIQINNIQILNIAGPRESSSPGIYWSAMNYLRQLFELLNGENVPHR